MTRVTGWRAAIAVVAVLVLVSLLLAAIFWLAIALAAVAAVAWFNLLLLPRLSVRLRVPILALAVLLLAPLAGVGYLLAGVSGALEGTAIWLLGVALPRAVLWQVQRRLDQRKSDRDRVTIVLPYRPQP